MKYQAKRSIIINSELEKVQNYVRDFSNWKSWSPWSIIEPDHKQEITGNPGENGHSMTWDGEVIGSGVNTIERIEGDSIFYNLEFIKPFKSKAKTSFEFKEVDGGTEVTWTMDGNMPFFMFFMIKMMKSWIEMDYDRGLMMLKAMIEEGKVDADTTNEGVKEFEGFSYVGIQKTSSLEDMPKEMSESFEIIMQKLKDEGKTAKQWLSLYPKVDMANKMFTYIAAVSDEDLKDVQFDNQFVKGDLEGGNMFEIKHNGSYRFLGNAWSMGMMHVRAQKMKQTGKPFEYYWNNPKEVKENELKTSIYFPVK